jgi:hypothetical protein
MEEGKGEGAPENEDAEVASNNLEENTRQSDAGMIEGDSHMLEGDREEDERPQPQRRGINKGSKDRAPKNNPTFFKDRETLLEEQRHLREEFSALTQQSASLKSKAAGLAHESEDLKKLMGKLNAQVTLAHAAHSAGAGYGSGLGSDASRRSVTTAGKDSVLALEATVLELRVMNNDFKRQYEVLRATAGTHAEMPMPDRPTYFPIGVIFAHMFFSHTQECQLFKLTFQYHQSITRQSRRPDVTREKVCKGKPFLFERGASAHLPDFDSCSA